MSPCATSFLLLNCLLSRSMAVLVYNLFTPYHALSVCSSVCLLSLSQSPSVSVFFCVSFLLFYIHLSSSVFLSLLSASYRSSLSFSSSPSPSVCVSLHPCVLFLYYFPSVSLHPSRSLPLVISQPPLSPCSTHHLPVPVNPSAPHPYPVVLSLYARPCNRLRLLPLASLSPSPTAIDVCSLSLTHTDISHSIDSWTIMSPQPPANPHIQRTPRMTVGGARA